MPLVNTGLVQDPGASNPNRAIVGKPTSTLASIPAPLSVASLMQGNDADNTALQLSIKSLMDSQNAIIGYLQAQAKAGGVTTGPQTVTAATVAGGVKITWQDEISTAQPVVYQIWRAAAGTRSAPTTPLFSAAVRIAKVPAYNPGGVGSTFYPVGSLYQWFDGDFGQLSPTNPSRATYWVTTLDNRGNESIAIQASSTPVEILPSAYVLLQSATPGGQQTGNANISGNLILGVGNGSLVLGPWAPAPNNYVLFGNNALNQGLTTNYALLQSNLGRTFVNCASGQDITFRVANSVTGDNMRIDATGITMNSDAFGGFIQHVFNTELLTIAAAATTDSVGLLIPANAIIIGVTTRVVTVIPTAVTYKVSSTTGAVFFQGQAGSADPSTAAGTTDPGVQQWHVGAGGVPQMVLPAASKVRITPSAVPGAATGQVRITVHALVVSPPTS